MDNVMIVGPFNPAMRRALENSLPREEFSLHYIESTEEYKQLKEADYIILRTLSIGKDDIATMKKTKLIQRWGAGYDTVDIKAAGEKGIPVAVTAGMNAVPVSEMALALALAVYRNLIPLTAGVMAGRWEREEYSKRSFTLNGKTVGIYGIGAIGKKVASLYNAFGSKVIYYDPYRLSPEQEEALRVEYVEQEKLFRESDILTLHAPLTESTRNIINKETLNMMKNGSVLINTAREELTDLQAVAEELKSGKLLGAGFDAIEETVVANNPFVGLNNVVLTTHLGGNTVDNAVHMAKRCADLIMAVKKGQHLEPPHLVNGAFLKA